MALVSGGRSTLNPNAPMFIPAAFRQVEDFSPEWWELVTASPWYHNYWLSQHQDEDGFYSNEDKNIDDIVDLLPESFSLDADDGFDSIAAQFEEFIRLSELEGDKSSPLPSNSVDEYGFGTEALTQNVKFSEAKSPKFLVEHTKYAEKPAKNSSVKYSPRRIQQPR